MGPTDSLRRQHDELLEVATKIAALLNPEAIEQKAEEIASLLAKLAGKLKMHLAMEDKSLYPKMISSTDTTTKDLAEKFIAEMGEISSVFSQYMNDWSSPTAMRADPKGFIKVTTDLFGAVKKRIDRENGQLYPQLEATY